MTSLMQRNARLIQHGAPQRLFDIGQSVRLKGGPGAGPRPGETYRITGTLPPKGTSLQYRIRSEGEPYDRVVTEDSLEPVIAPASDSGAALIERTFGHGQGTETLEPQNQEAEAGKSAGQA
jgi:hypothetical protein